MKTPTYLLELCETNMLIYTLFLNEAKKDETLSEADQINQALTLSKNWMTKQGVLSGVMNPIGIDSELSPLDFSLTYGALQINNFLKLKLGLE